MNAKLFTIVTDHRDGSKSTMEYLSVEDVLAVVEGAMDNYDGFELTLFETLER